jgi:hypothetical protein
MSKQSLFLSLLFLPLGVQSQNTSTYRLSDLYEIHQDINTSGLAYITTPFQRKDLIEISQDTELFFIVAYSDHLAVYDKKQNNWQIFGLANGYPFVNHPVRIQANYKTKFVLAGSKTNTASAPSRKIKSDTTDYVIVFDKISKTLSTLKLEQYLSQSSTWQAENYENKNERWYIQRDDFHAIVHHDLKNNKKIRFSPNVWTMSISSVEVFDNKFYVAYKNGIAVFESDPALDAIYQFPLPPIKDLEGNKDEILVVYDSAFELVDKNLKSQQYVRLPANTGPASFDNKYFFLTHNHKLKVKRRSNLEDTLHFSFNAAIIDLKRIANQLLVFTSAGYASISMRDFKVSHYLQSNADSTNVNHDFGWRWIGQLNDLLFFYDNRIGENQLVSFSVDGNPKPIDHIINSLTAISGGNYLTKEGGIYKVFELNSINSSSSLFEFQLKDESVPNAFQDQSDHPVGSRVIAFNRMKDIFSIATDKGLFFYDYSQKKWRSHFITDLRVHTGGGLLVRNKVIYSFGEASSRAAGVITKIDRKNYKITNYSTQFHNAYFRSIKIKGDELICANPDGIVHFDFRTKKEQPRTLPERISQVAFYNKNYLAVSGERIYLSNKKGDILKKWELGHQLMDEYAPSPKLVELDDDNLWINSVKLLQGQLTYFSLAKTEQHDFHFREGTAMKIIPGIDYTWIFGHDDIYRYSKKTSSLYKLGLIRDPINSVPIRTAYITDAIEHDSVLYVVTQSGIFQVQKKSLIIRKCNLPYFENSITNIAKDDDAYIMSSYHGVFQIDAATFESSFTGNPFQFFNYFKPDTGVLLPFSYNGIVRIVDKNHNQLFYFTLKTELANHAVLKDFLYPDKYLKFLINGHELKIRGGGMNQADPIETLFYLSIPPEILQKGSNALKVIDRSQQDLILKEWQLLVN